MTLAGAPPSRLTASLGVGLAAFSAVTFGFGTTLALFAYQGGSNPVTVVVLRTAAFVIVVGLILLSLGRLRRLSRQALIGSLWMAVTLTVVSLGYQGSVAFISVSLAALIFYTFPLLVGLFAVVTRRDSLTASKAIALIAAFLGLALALGPEFATLDWRGITLALFAAVGMALTLAFGRDATRNEDALLMAVYTNVWMLVVLTAFAALAGSIAFPVTSAGALGLIGLCTTYVVAYVCWYLALSLVRPVRLAAMFNIEPLVTLFVAWLILGERLSSIQLAGAALVLASVLSMSLPRSEAAALHERD